MRLLPTLSFVVLLTCTSAHAPSARSPLGSFSSAAPSHRLLFNESVEDETVDALIGSINAANNRGDKRIVIEINTPGGSVWAGMRLAKAIEESPAPVTCVVDGMAASMGFYILQSCHTRVMTRRSLLMTHQPATGGLLYGPAEKYEGLAELLRKLSHAMVEHMAARMKISVADFEKRIDGKDWWLTNDEAVAVGAVDALVHKPSEVP